MEDDIPEEIGVMAIAQQPVLEKDATPDKTLAIVPMQAEEYAKQLIGKGVYDNHSPNESGDVNELGVVRSSWISPDGHIMAYARLFGKTPRGRELIKKVLSGAYRGCSLGSRHFTNKAGAKERSEPIEFTLCEEGAIPGSETLVVCASKKPAESVVEKPVHVQREMPDGTKIDTVGLFVGEHYMVSQFGKEKEVEMSDPSNEPKPSETPTNSPATEKPAAEAPAATETPAEKPAAEAAAVNPEVEKMQKQMEEMKKQNERLLQEQNRMRAAEAERIRKSTLEKIENESKPKMEAVLSFLKESSAERSAQTIEALETFIRQPDLLLDDGVFEQCMASVEAILPAADIWNERKNSGKEAEQEQSMQSSAQPVEVNAGKHASRGGFDQMENEYQQRMAKAQKEMAEKEAQIARLQKERDELDNLARAANNELASKRKQPLSWQSYARNARGSQPAKREREEEQEETERGSMEQQEGRVVEAFASKRTRFETDNALALYISQWQARNGADIPEHQNCLETFASAGYSPQSDFSTEDAARVGARKWWSQNMSSFHSSFVAPRVTKEEAVLHNLPKDDELAWVKSNRSAPSIAAELRRNPPISE